MRNCRKQLGAITVEATISLTAFMFAIVTVLTALNVCTVQAKIANALNLTAREISQYSYLYSLTGFNSSVNKVKDAAAKKVEKVDGVVENVTAVYNSAVSLTGDAKTTVDDIRSGNITTNEIAGAANEWKSKLSAIGSQGESAYSSIKSLFSDPKSLIYGFAQMAASDALTAGDSLLSGLIAKGMCARHLCNVEGGDPEQYLKFLRVVPKNGSYIDGIDFSGSRIFTGKSDEIKLSAVYDVKLITLLPLDFTFHFHQTAITRGWSVGEVNYTPGKSYVNNKTLWTETTINERSTTIRQTEMERLKETGYQNVSNLTDVQMYNPQSNDFLMIKSMNPLYSQKGESTMTLDDLNDTAIRDSIEQMCAKMKTNTDGKIDIETKEKGYGKTPYSVEGASNTIVLVIPEDEGLKEHIQSVIDESKTYGVKIELRADYGKGANKVEKDSEKSTNNG